MAEFVLFCTTMIATGLLCSLAGFLLHRYTEANTTLTAILVGGGLVVAVEGVDTLSTLWVPVEGLVGMFLYIVILIALWRSMGSEGGPHGP